MTPSVLTIVPSRGRPELLQEMMDSWAATRVLPGALVAYISQDDPEYIKYSRVALPSDCHIIQGPRQFITQTYNEFTFGNLGAYDYFAPLNDDHLCVTPGWDKALVELLDEKSHGWGCAMANDNLTNWNDFPHPSGCVISRKTLEVLGYMFWPKLRHIGNDIIMGKLYKALGILHGRMDVVIEHRHWVNGKRAFDDNYRWVYGKEEQDYGDREVREYFSTQYDEDFRKLSEAMKND